MGLKGFCASELPSPPYPPSRPMVAGQTECAALGYAMRSVGHRSVLELFWQQAEISVCRLRMAVQSLLMAIQRLRMCIQRLQTEISPSTQKTFTILPERILKGGGKHALCSRLCCAKLCCGLLPPCPSRPNGHIYPSESGKTSIRRQQDIRSETIKASADVRLHTSGCLLDDKREGTTPPLAAAFYPRVN